MNRRRIFGWAAACAVFVSTCAGAEPPADEPGAAGERDYPGIFDRVEEYRLDNGMLFLLVERHDVPTVAGQVIFRVGNVDNPAGKTGLAHMFEHMAFKGTDRIGPEEYPRLLEGFTYNFNAWTSTDFTDYIMLIPANVLEAWMLMESERHQFPSFADFDSEREIVIEERRSSSEDNPTAMAQELLQALAFSAHPYRYPVIGYMDDLEHLTRDDVIGFHERYYGPGNATGVLVGDFSTAEAKRLIADYFGDIPARDVAPGPAMEEPRHRGIRRGVHRQGTSRYLYMAFPGRRPGTREAAAARLLAEVLSRDKTSRLDARLDIRDHSVREIWCTPDYGLQRYAGLFVIGAQPLEGHTNEEIEKAIWEELARVAAEPVAAEKLEQIKSSNRKEFYYRLETNEKLAALLARNEAGPGDWRDAYLVYDKMDSVTVDEVTALASELLQEDLATVVYLEPEEADAAEGAAADGESGTTTGADADAERSSAGDRQ